MRGRGKVILRAKRDALSGLPKMWQKRQQIQKNRVGTIAGIWQRLCVLTIKKTPDFTFAGHYRPGAFRFIPRWTKPLFAQSRGQDAK